jgi:hypothetical protein
LHDYFCPNWRVYANTSQKEGTAVKGFCKIIAILLALSLLAGVICAVAGY